MSNKLDKVIEAACAVVNDMSPDQRALNAETSGSFGLLVRAVEAANLAPGEPIFCLRGRDRAAPATLYVWMVKAEDLGAPPENVSQVRQKHQAFLDWQADLKNSLLVKVPT